MTGGPVDLKAIERKPLATTIADLLRGHILEGRFRVGERLPPERELAQVLKVTRTTLREAVKILETLRLVAVRQGDGVRVRDYLRGANLDILTDLLFRGGAVDGPLLANVLEARAIFGTALARLAAQRRTVAQVDEYARRVAALEETTAPMLDADLDCFDVLADASGNLVFTFVIGWIRSICERHRDLFAVLYLDPDRVKAAHRDLLAALRAGDGPRAEAAAATLLTCPEPPARTGACPDNS